MEWAKVDQFSKYLAEYFVYYCGEGDHYVKLTDQLREVNTRSSLLKAIYMLLKYGEVQCKQKMKGMSPKKLKDLFHFLKTGEIEKISQFRASLVADISTFELEKIHQQEQYLVDLLTQ